MTKIISACALILLLACDTGIELNLECLLKHTTEVATLESSAVTIQETYINLSWTWIGDTPDGDGVIIERKTDASFDSIGYVTPIETLMTFSDESEVLVPESEVSYRLGLLKDETIDYFDTTDIVIPPAQHIVQPDTEFVSIPLDTLTIIFNTLSGFDTTDVALYKTSFLAVDSLLNTPLQDLLSILTDPVLSTTTTDTSVTFYAPGTVLEPNAVYAIKVSCSKVSNLDYITDSSIGIRAFVRTD